jgi:hypothetical protein
MFCQKVLLAFSCIREPPICLQRFIRCYKIPGKKIGMMMLTEQECSNSTFCRLLFLHLTFNRMLPSNWYAPQCERVVDPVNWDFDSCFEQTTLDALPHLILFLAGGYAFPRLWRKYKNGRHETLSRQGKAAYGIKMVSLHQFILPSTLNRESSICNSC